MHPDGTPLLVRTMNVETTGCLPFACNHIIPNVNDRCAVCFTKLPFITHEYPVPAHSSFEVPPSPTHYVTFDPRLVVPADISNGRNHLYVCKNCKMPGRPKQGPKQNLALYKYMRTPGIAGQIEKANGNAWFDKHVHPGLKRKEYPVATWNYLMGLGEMGAFEANSSKTKAPMGTMYRVYKNEEQKIEFLHLDKFYGKQIQGKHADPTYWFPLWLSYRTDPVMMGHMEELRKKCYSLIYSKERHVECDVGPAVENNTQIYNLEEHETKFIKNFGLHSVLNYQAHATQLDANYRWWNGHMTYRVLINGEDTGLVEFKLKRTEKKRKFGELGNLEMTNSLYLYNVAAFKVGNDLTPHCLWFAKHLAMWINKFSDIRSVDGYSLDNVYLTTSTRNSAFSKAQQGSGFYKVPNEDVYWDVHYCWDLPRLEQASPLELANPPNHIIGVSCNLQLIDDIVKDPANVLDSTFI